MTINVPIAEAKAKFSELVRRAESGEAINLTRHGEVVATLSAPSSKGGARGLVGLLKGQISIADDFDDLGPEWDDYVR